MEFVRNTSNKQACDKKAMAIKYSYASRSIADTAKFSDKNISMKHDETLSENLSIDKFYTAKQPPITESKILQMSENLINRKLC